MYKLHITYVRYQTRLKTNRNMELHYYFYLFMTR